MAMQFRPAIVKGSTWHELPRPVQQLRLQQAWDVEQFHVPLATGDLTVGPSQRGLLIQIEGQCGTHEGVPLSGEVAMFDALAELRSALHRGPDDDRWEFVIYHDLADNGVRCLRNCTTVRFDFDLSDPHSFSYSIQLHADDPAIHESLA